MSDDLATPRERAVTLRLAGQTLAAVARQTGLSAPTITALVKAYERGGWPAVHERKRGRPRSDAATHAQPQLPELKESFLNEGASKRARGPVFTVADLAAWVAAKTGSPTNEHAAAQLLSAWQLLPPDERNSAGTLPAGPEHTLYWARGPKNELFVMPSRLPLTDDAYCQLFEALAARFPRGLDIALDFAGLKYTPKLQTWLESHQEFRLTTLSPPTQPITPKRAAEHTPALTTGRLTHLQRLEAESIAIMREVVAEADNPVMLYSIGKDSTVMLHLALKAFYPAKVPFPLLHIDSTWEFRAMYAFAEQIKKEHGITLISYQNEEGLAQGINPFTHGSQIHTDVLRTQGLKQALDKFQFDVAFGGGRRDEEKSRAKERVFSFRTKDHRWDPKNQRPELWNLYNTKKNKGESIRVFPISNWTELDVWQYIHQENIPIVPLYLSAPRPVVNRGGTLIMVDDERMPLSPGEVPMIKSVRFRTLGCYPFTGAVESTAANLEELIEEMRLANTSERQGRVIDHDGAASMEKKKQEGYF
jgi:sulfate adenylyltransferase subunit 2